MKINQPQELKDVEKTIEILLNIDFIVLEKIHDKKGNYDEYIIKQKTPEITLWDKISKKLDRDWIGQIIKDKSNGKYYFCDESGTLKSVFRLNEWDKIQKVMNALAFTLLTQPAIAGDIISVKRESDEKREIMLR